MGLLGPQVSTVIRSQLSKVVTERELGKVYTMLGCLEAAIPLAAAPLLTEIYNNTLETFPGEISVIIVIITQHQQSPPQAPCI